MTLREFLKRTYGRLNILINNAGIIAKGDAPGLEVDMETVRVTLETNALGPLHLSQALVPLLQSSKPARIVNISSGMGAFSEMEGDYAAYRISKTALNAATAILAAELRNRIAVNAACPGWVRTDMGGRSADRDVTEGADTPVWLALDAPQRLTGKFVRDRKVISSPRMRPYHSIYLRYERACYVEVAAPGFVINARARAHSFRA